MPDLPLEDHRLQCDDAPSTSCTGAFIAYGEIKQHTSSPLMVLAPDSLSSEVYRDLIGHRSVSHGAAPRDAIRAIVWLRSRRRPVFRDVEMT